MRSRQRENALTRRLGRPLQSRSRVIQAHSRLAGKLVGETGRAGLRWGKGCGDGAEDLREGGCRSPVQRDCDAREIIDEYVSWDRDQTLRLIVPSPARIQGLSHSVASMIAAPRRQRVSGIVCLA